MRKAITAPLPCFGLEQDARSEKCKACPHFMGCREAMGMRADRTTLGSLRFEFLPETMERSYDTPAGDGRDLNEIYQTTYRQVYGKNPAETPGHITDRVSELARRAKVSLPMYVLTNMVGFQLAWPEHDFKVANLVDNRALYRVRVYTKACLEMYATTDAHALDNLTRGDTAAYAIETRMLNSEKLAGEWIIQWKLDNEGPPYTTMFTALEEQLDPNWLAIEARYTPILLSFIKHPTNEVQHAVAEAMHRLKKRKHEARGNFLARERCMPQAIGDVLKVFGYTPDDFEAPQQPVTDPLRFWHRLALAIQHMECLKYIDGYEGYYAES